MNELIGPSALWSVEYRGSLLSDVGFRYVVAETLGEALIKIQQHIDAYWEAQPSEERESPYAQKPVVLSVKLFDQRVIV